MSFMSLLFDLFLFAHYLIIIFAESNVVKIESISDTEESTRINKKKCRICGLRGHNARTCSAESDTELESNNDTEEISRN
ncbi:18969_t:CDS:1, partial [Dentiscutata erythropus]